ncbi:hypothetical protein [Flavobacterium sp.]|uniref:hypothetical protein n=1 Tax=Flavobacterium sp. TaxID=239 RepID=UPI0033405B8F
MPETQKKLKINVFGELWTLKKVALSPIELDYYGSIAAGMNLSLHNALIDPFFYPKLKLENTQSFFDLKGTIISGITNHSLNQIEIWHNGNKEKIWIANLKNTSLFPTYKLKFETIENTLSNGIYIETKEFGKIGSFETTIDNYERENLEFNFINYGTNLLLQNNFSYKGKFLSLKKTDCNITRLISFEV